MATGMWAVGPVTMKRVALLAMASVALMGAQSCSWFKKKDQNEGANKLAQPISTPKEPTETPRPPIDPQTESGLQTIYFDFDQAALRADQISKADNNLRWLTENANAKVIIEGHCDERGTTEYNFALGERRARAVMDYLVKGGIGEGRITLLSKGEEEPAAAAHDESAWSLNRRAVFLRTE